ncbi:MAG TPA: DUF6249 domain-containing protein [Chthoniobacterales bacterium]|nr:DUF6249 domain-containing protein [Chthoniobacterales bacterium]
MKTTLLIFFSSMALALTAFGQTATPVMSPAPQTTTSAATSPAVATTSATISATPDREESIESEVARKLKRKFGITIDSPHGTTHVSRHHNSGDGDDEDLGALMAIPIVGIIFTTLFGAPVMVVAAIMFFSYLKSRSLHRTVRTMVEKGQEVPAALFAPPPIVRARSDMRRGVVLLMVGIGIMIFLGAANDWEGGAWSLGMIPFLIGAGYLIVWKLEGRKDKVPPLS